jgi:hypothetical protein
MRILLAKYTFNKTKKISKSFSILILLMNMVKILVFRAYFIHLFASKMKICMLNLLLLNNASIAGLYNLFGE